MVNEDDIAAARAGNAEAIARLGAEAYATGRIVEATYWTVMARLRGLVELDAVLGNYVGVWKAIGCPEQIGFTNAVFSEEQRQFGFSALLWLGNVDRPFARIWFSRAAHAGNYDARDFMMVYSSQV